MEGVNVFKLSIKMCLNNYQIEYFLDYGGYLTLRDRIELPSLPLQGRALPLNYRSLL